MDELYREEILDHYRSSPHRGALTDADSTFEDDNPLCGDRVRMDVKIADDGSISEVRFGGAGCAISQATASMLCEAAVGKRLGDVTNWDRHQVLDLLNISLTPIRLKCALLPLKVLQAALWRYAARDGTTNEAEPRMGTDGTTDEAGDGTTNNTNDTNKENEE